MTGQREEEIIVGNFNFMCKCIFYFIANTNHGGKKERDAFLYKSLLILRREIWLHFALRVHIWFVRI
jgi:hypothetical protein